jgi:hypothetical protein
MQHRFFDIVIETDNGDVGLGREFVLDIPEYDMDQPVERMEQVGAMLDVLVATTGQPVCSFRSEPVVLT